MRQIIVIFALIFITGAVFAQDFNLRYVKTDTELFPIITAAVQVYDSFDEPVTDLKRENFQAAVDGRAADSLNATTYKESGMGLNIMLCVDLSGSIEGEPLKAMKYAVLRFIDDLRAVDKLGIMGFADDAELITDFSNNKEYLRQKIESLETEGTHTALFYGAYKAIKALAENKEKTGKILLLMGDGKDESLAQSYKEEDVIEIGKEKGIPVFAIGYTKVEKMYLQSLERMAEKTGGNFYDSPADSELSKQYQKLYRQILNIYLLTFKVRGIEGDGSEHINVIATKNNTVTKSVSGKFIAPAGVFTAEKGGSNEKPEEIIKSGMPGMYYYIIGIGIIILLAIAGGVFVVISRSRKKKLEEERLKAEDEKKRRQEEVEEENKKRAEIERKLEEKNRSDTKTKEVEDRKPVQKTVIEPVPVMERTRISTPEDKIISVTGLRLEFQIGIIQGKRIEVGAGGATIGRKEGNGIVINDETLSGNHAKIIFSGGSFYIEDLGSSNGTFVNGRKISQVSKLNDNDTFKFGRSEGVVKIY